MFLSIIIIISQVSYLILSFLIYARPMSSSVLLFAFFVRILGEEKKQFAKRKRKLSVLLTNFYLTFQTISTDAHTYQSNTITNHATFQLSCDR